MNVHKNARTTPRSRALIVHPVMHEHSSVSDVASALSVSRRTVCKWLACYRTEGLRGLAIAARLPIAARMRWRYCGKVVSTIAYSLTLQCNIKRSGLRARRKSCSRQVDFVECRRDTDRCWRKLFARADGSRKSSPIPPARR